MWTAKKAEMNASGTLRAACRGSKNAFTVGNGHRPEVTEGTREAPGNRRFARMSGPGGWSAVRDDRTAGRVGRGPGGVLSISYMEGTFVVSRRMPRCTARRHRERELRLRDRRAAWGSSDRRVSRTSA